MKNKLSFKIRITVHYCRIKNKKWIDQFRIQNKAILFGKNNCTKLNKEEGKIE